MLVIKLSEKEIKNTAIYNSIKDRHIVISITDGDSSEIVIPPNQNRVAELHLKFDDVSDLDDRYIYFTRGQAVEILDFVNQYCRQISMIVVQCHAGLSRSVAVAAALSKIMNYTDDMVYTKGIPNMFVYTTILDTFFGDLYWQKKWSGMVQHRLKAMGQFLSPAMIRMESVKESKRLS